MIFPTAGRTSFFIPLFLLNCLIVVNGFSQTTQLDSLKRKYESEAIWLEIPHYWKNGERMHFSKLKNEFNNSTRGKIEYEVGIKKYKTGRVLAFVSAAAIIGSVIALDSNQPLAYGLLAGGVVINLISIKFAIDGRRQLQKAVFLRNQDLLFSPLRSP